VTVIGNWYAAPVGVTVIGNWYAAPSSDASGVIGFFEATLPARAPAIFIASTSNTGAGTANSTDADPDCNGSVNNPTAPAGKMCWYVGTQVGLSAIAGFASAGSDFHGASIRVTDAGAGTDSYARGSWAYTAP
jgi:hypothetical protein